jgi:hypothetical protein
MSRLLDWHAAHAIILVHLSLAIYQNLILFHLEESRQKRTVTSLDGFLDLLTFPRKLLTFSLTDFLDQSAPLVQRRLVLMHLQELGDLVQLDLLRIGRRLRLLLEVVSIDGRSLSKNRLLLIHDSHWVTSI